MRRLLVLPSLVVATLVSAASVSAQEPGPAVVSPFRGVNSIYGAPGYYGTSYGTASFGVPRLYSEFSSPYGMGYGYGYAPTAPAYAFTVGLWRSGTSSSSTTYGAPGSYRTFPVRTWPRPSGTGPPFGEYAPAFGPQAAMTR